MEMVLEILKWVAVVFLAGFIGYFGKHLGRIIIAKFSKKSEPDTHIPAAENEINYKHEKKRLKQIQKIEKKRPKEN
jgi:hypothetical protein